MNETIGVKGGKNDSRRRMIITKNQLEKLKLFQEEQKEKELKELEKKVKLQQRLSLIVALPIATIGQVYETLTHANLKRKELLLKEVIELLEKENIFSERDTKEIINALKEGNIFLLDEELLGKLGFSFETTKRVSENDLRDLPTPDKKEEISVETKSKILDLVEITLEEKQQELTNSNQEKDLINEKLDKLKNHKIIDEYETKLKDVRKDLRQLVFEYNVISEESENLYESKEAEALLERLNSIIKKIDELKRRIDIPDIDKYDDNYLYTLVEEYIEEFKNKHFVSEIKDSELYIMISEKLDELDKKKDKLQEKIETKKTNLELDEKRMDQMKENYYSFEKFNKDLTKFQEEQDKLLADIKEKISKSTTITERVETQVVAMNRHTRRLMTLMAASMMLPGARSARGMATLAATYLYFMRQLTRPNTRTRTYRQIDVKDYHKEIESSLSALENVEEMLKKTSKQITTTINEFEKEFKDYIDMFPECRELLDNLEKIKDEIEEKEHELKRIKEQQERQLEINNAKVLTRTRDALV